MHKHVNESESPALTQEQIARELADLKQRLEGLSRSVQSPRQWWIAGAGRFANDPVFDEIVRLGQQYRRSQRRPRPKSTAKRAHS